MLGGGKQKNKKELLFIGLRLVICRSLYILTSSRSLSLSLWSIFCSIRRSEIWPEILIQSEVVRSQLCRTPTPIRRLRLATTRTFGRLHVNVSSLSISFLCFDSFWFGLTCRISGFHVIYFWFRVLRSSHFSRLVSFWFWVLRPWERLSVGFCGLNWFAGGEYVSSMAKTCRGIALGQFSDEIFGEFCCVLNCFVLKC